VDIQKDSKKIWKTKALSCSPILVAIANQLGQLIDKMGWREMDMMMMVILVACGPEYLVGSRSDESLVTLSSSSSSSSSSKTMAAVLSSLFLSLFFSSPEYLSIR